MKALLTALLAALAVYLLYDTWTQKHPVSLRTGRLCDFTVAGAVFEDPQSVIRRGIRLLEVHIYSDERDQPVVALSPQVFGSNIAQDNISFESVCVTIANEAFPSKDPFILSMVLHTERTLTRYADPHRHYGTRWLPRNDEIIDLYAFTRLQEQVFRPNAGMMAVSCDSFGYQYSPGTHVRTREPPVPLVADSVRRQWCRRADL